MKRTMKEIYESLRLKLIFFETKAVIATSNQGEPDEDF